MLMELPKDVVKSLEEDNYIVAIFRGDILDGTGGYVRRPFRARHGLVHFVKTRNLSSRFQLHVEHAEFAIIWTVRDHTTYLQTLTTEQDNNSKLLHDIEYFYLICKHTMHDAIKMAML